MNYLTRQHWFDSVWPETPPDDKGYCLVPTQRHTNLEEIDAEAVNNPNEIFMLVIENFDDFSKGIPDSWRRMSPLGVGGIPPNVWIGASVQSQKDADKHMRRLVKIRARVLFLVLKKGHPQSIDLKPGLIAWRCQNCGRRDGYGRMKRPEECPTGSVCDGAVLGPQIHWVISMDPYESSARELRCERLGVAFWDGKSLEVPE